MTTASILNLYDIDQLTRQAMLLGYRLGTRYVLDVVGHGIELVEITVSRAKVCAGV